MIERTYLPPAQSEQVLSACLICNRTKHAIKPHLTEYFTRARPEIKFLLLQHDKPLSLTGICLPDMLHITLQAGKCVALPVRLCHGGAICSMALGLP